MRIRRIAHRFWGRSKSSHAQNGTQAATLAGVLRTQEHRADETSPVMPRAADRPILNKWPAGYENGSFRLVDGGVVLFAKGKPTLKIEEGGLVPPKSGG
jgi:hypothetical protein